MRSSTLATRPPMPLPPPRPTSETRSRRAVAVRDEATTCGARESNRGHVTVRSATADERPTVADRQRAEAAGGGLVVVGDCARPRDCAGLRAPGEWRIIAQQKRRHQPRRRQRELVESPAERVGERWKQQGKRERGRGKGGAAVRLTRSMRSMPPMDQMQKDRLGSVEIEVDLAHPWLPCFPGANEPAQTGTRGGRW